MRYNYPILAVLLLVACFLIPLEGSAQQDQATDTLPTPFRKGRWMTGLNGSFSSNTIELDSGSGLVSTNQYGLEISTGFFIRDRWFLGANVFAQRGSGGGFIERDFESFLLGPSLSYYFLKDHFGSLYLRVLPGYVRFRDETRFEQGNNILTETVDGPGFGLNFRLGYSYVINDIIVLDVGVDNAFSWLDVEISDLDNVDLEQSIFNNTTSFSFGFKVILDEFFF